MEGQREGGREGEKERGEIREERRERERERGERERERERSCSGPAGKAAAWCRVFAAAGKRRRKTRRLSSTSYALCLLARPCSLDRPRRPRARPPCRLGTQFPAGAHPRSRCRGRAAALGMAGRTGRRRLKLRGAYHGNAVLLHCREWCAGPGGGGRRRPATGVVRARSQGEAGDFTYCVALNNLSR